MGRRMGYLGTKLPRACVGAVALAALAALSSAARLPGEPACTEGCRLVLATAAPPEATVDGSDAGDGEVDSRAGPSWASGAQVLETSYVRVEVDTQAGAFRVLDAATGVELAASAGGKHPWLGFTQWLGHDFSALYEGYAFRLGTRIATHAAGRVAAWRRMHDGGLCGRENALAGDRSCDALQLSMDTGDLRGRRINVTVSLAGERAIAMDFEVLPPTLPKLWWERLLPTTRLTQERIRFALKTKRGRGAFGLGERFDHANREGTKAYCWAEDGGWGFGTNMRLPKGAASTYMPVPFWLQRDGTGLWLNTTSRTEIDFGKEDQERIYVQTENARIRLVILTEPTPRDALGAFTARVGRPLIPPKFQLGPWKQMDMLDETAHPFSARSFSGLQAAEWLADQDVPTSVNIWAVHFSPTDRDFDQFDYLKAGNAAFHELGLKTLSYVNPMVSKTSNRLYAEAHAKGYFVRSESGAPDVFLYKGAGIIPFLVSSVDFTSAAAVKWFQQKVLKPPIDAGFSGFMYDYGEYVGKYTRASTGEAGATLHNAYPVLYQRAGYEFLTASDPLRVEAGYAPDYIFYTRSGYTGTSGSTWATWTGDPFSDFSHTSGLPAQVNAMLTAGMAGIAFSGSDIGGFVWTETVPLELWARWAQVGALSGIMREQLGGTPLTQHIKGNIHQYLGGTAIWRRNAKLRTQLFPYLYTASHEARTHGLPLMRHHILSFPEDDEAVKQNHQYMLGPDLLCAPVVAHGITEMQVYLPKGASWVDLSSGMLYDAKDGRHRLAYAPAVVGGDYVVVPAPVDGTPPLFARAGSVIAAVDPTVDTLVESAADQRVVALGERAHIVHLWFAPDSNLGARGKTWDGLEVVLSTDGSGETSLMIGDAASRTHVAQLPLPLAPCGVLIDSRGVELPRADGWSQVVDAAAPIDASCWFWDDVPRVLWVRTATGSSTVRFNTTCSAGASL